MLLGNVTDINHKGKKMKKMIRFAAGTMTAFATALLFCASASASVLTSKANVDNGYAVYISTDDAVAGTFFGSGNYWPNTDVFSTSLVAGTDYFVHVYAYDQGGLAGFLGEFSLAGGDHHFANNATTLLTGDTAWTGSAVGFGSTAPGLTDRGLNGVGPWGYQGAINGSAHWIWLGDADANDASYFSARVLADARVPEPATVALLGLSLLGMAAARRKSRNGNQV